MLACTNNRDRSSFRKYSGDKVVFKNVLKRYKFPSTVTVEYILSPKVKTSTHDYVGIYRRDWKDLREFAGFEHPISAPFEEPNLYRCIQFICQPPHVSASPNQDYQFVYVDQSQQVLGRSNFFQFGDDIGQEGHPSDWWLKKEVGWQEETVTSKSLDAVSIQLTPCEIAYNECFFRNQDASYDNINQYHGTSDMQSACLSDAPNAYPTLQDCSKPFCIPENFSKRQSLPKSAENAQSDFKPRRWRALIKTSGTFLNDHRDVPPPNEVNDQANNTSMDLIYSQNWLQPKQNVSNRMNCLVPGRGDVNCGAIPKQCPKCHAPSDYNHKQQLMQHELSQAYEQIRDLRNELDQLQKNLQLSQAAHAKLRAASEMAKLGDKNLILLKTLIQSSLASQYGAKVTGCIGPAAPPVVREIESPVWCVPSNQQLKQINYMRAPNEERKRSGRDKELKAMIGCQEKTIQLLLGQLLEARKFIEDSKALKSGQLNTELSEQSKGGNLCTSSRMDSGVIAQGEHGNKDLSSPSYDSKSCLLSEAKDLSNKTSNENCCSPTTVGVQPDGGAPKCFGLNAFSNVEKSSETQIAPIDSKQPLENSLIVEPKFYHVDPFKSSDCKVVLDDDLNLITSDEEAKGSPKEANNNNSETKNLNSVGSTNVNSHRCK